MLKQLLPLLVLLFYSVLQRLYAYQKIHPSLSKKSTQMQENNYYSAALTSKQAFTTRKMKLRIKYIKFITSNLSLLLSAFFRQKHKICFLNSRWHFKIRCSVTAISSETHEPDRRLSNCRSFWCNVTSWSSGSSGHLFARQPLSVLY